MEEQVHNHMYDKKIMEKQVKFMIVRNYRFILFDLPNNMQQLKQNDIYRKYYHSSIMLMQNIRNLDLTSLKTNIFLTTKVSLHPCQTV